MRWPGSRVYNNYPLVVEQSQNITNVMLKDIIHNDSRAVLISNLMYTEYDGKVTTRWLQRNQDWDYIVLERLLDPPEIHAEIWKHLGRPVYSFGYGAEKNFVDCWAIIADNLFTWPDQDTLLDADSIQQPYLSYNRKPTFHRRRLYSLLHDHRCLDKGIFTLGSKNPSERYLPHDLDFVSEDIPLDHNFTTQPSEISGDWGIPNDIFSLGSLDIWNQCLFNIVTETIYDVTAWGFVSEKIFKPLIGCRPFVVFSPDGGTAWLRARQFETYHEDFKDISDADPSNPDQLAQFVWDLNQQPVSYLKHKFRSLTPKLIYNRNILKQYIQQQQAKLLQGLDREP